MKEAERKMPRLYPHDVKEIPGSRALIVAVREQQVPWAIVTSGTKPYAEEWFKLVSLPLPPVMVNAEDVEHGKPDPSCYTLACQRLALPLSAPMLVVEDSPAGIRAGKASGFTVLGLLTTHSLDEIRGAGADYIIKDLSDAKLLAEDAAKEEGFLIELRDTR